MTYELIITSGFEKDTKAVLKKDMFFLIGYKQLLIIFWNIRNAVNPCVMFSKDLAGFTLATLF